MLKYSIIVLVQNKPELTKACLDSVAKYSENYELIVVDNGSSPAYAGPGTILRNEQNLGFPIGCNQGINASHGEVIVLLNNDTLVTPQWLDHIGAQLENYDMVGPVTNCISGPQQVAFAGFKLPEAINEASEAIHARNAGRSMPWFRLVFYCVAIKRSVIDAIGLLDEDFTPGNFEDDDYCLRAVKAGFKLGIAEDCLIYHKGSATFQGASPEYKTLILRNQTKLQNKWSESEYNAMQKKAVENCACNPPQKKRTLALCMVCKNEEQGLERAILSVKDLVDEIVIAVDNGSTDKTLEIAQKYATTVKRFDWRDDFAWARNFAHEGVKSDWIVFLDGHEYVMKHENLDQMLSSPAEGLLCTVELENGSRFQNPRIYRNGLKFEGAVHEIQNSRTITVYPDFVVKHAREGGQAQEAIWERNRQREDQIPRIMGAQLKADPKDTRSALHLALHEQSMGHFKEAMKYQKKYFKYAIGSGDRWYMYFNQALCRLALGHNLRALWATDKAEKETVGRWENAKLRGMIYFQARRFSKAIKFFVDSFDENHCDETFKPWLRKDNDTWNLIGESYFNLEKFDLAAQAFDQAHKLETEQEKKRLYFNRARLMQKMAKIGYND